MLLIAHAIGKSRAPEMSTNILYKYVDITTLKKIIDGSIRMTQPGAFNDPYELLPELVIHKDDAGKKIELSFDIASERRHYPVENISHIGDEYTSSDVTSRNIVKELNNLIGILCLSRSNNSMLMWSHYANQYTGAVIEFDATNDFFSNQIDVEYRKTRDKKELVSYLSSPIPIAELCVKSMDWQYEQEVRVVRLLSQCTNTGTLDHRKFPIFIKQIPRECIKTIALGERTTISDQRDIYSRIKDTDIGLSLSAVENYGYGFRQEIIKFHGPVRLGPVISPRTAQVFSHLKTPLGDLARNIIETHPASNIVNTIA